MSWDAPFDSSYDLDLHVLEILNQGYKSDENEIPEAGQPCRNALRAAASPGQLPVNDSQRLGAEPSPLSLPPELSSSRNCRGAGRGAAAPNHNEAALRALVQALQEKLKILEPEPPHPGDRVAGSKPIELAPRAAFRGVANTAKQPSSQRPLSAQLHGRTSSSAVGLLGAPVLKGAKAVEERTGCWPGRSGAAGAAPGRGDIRHAGTPRAAERNGCRGAGGPDAGGACAASQQQQQEQQKQQLEGLSRAALLTRVRKAEQEAATLRKSEALARQRCEYLAEGVRAGRSTQGVAVRQAEAARKVAARSEEERRTLQRQVEHLSTFLRKEKEAREAADQALATERQRCSGLAVQLAAAQQQLRHMQDLLDEARQQYGHFLAVNKQASERAARLQSRLRRAVAGQAAAQQEALACRVARDQAETQVSGMRRLLEELYSQRASGQLGEALQHQLEALLQAQPQRAGGCPQPADAPHGAASRKRAGHNAHQVSAFVAPGVKDAVRPAAASAAAADPGSHATLELAAPAEAGDATPGVPLRDGRGGNAADLAAAVAAIGARRGSAPAAKAAQRSGGGGAEGSGSGAEETCTCCGGSPGGEGGGAETPLMYRRVQLALGQRVAGGGGGGGAAAGVSEHAAAAAALGFLPDSEPATPEPGRGSEGDENGDGQGGAGARHHERAPGYGSGQGALAYLMAGSPASSVAQSVASSCVPSRAAAGLPARARVVQRPAAGATGGVAAWPAGPSTRPAVRKVQALSPARAAASSRPRATQQVGKAREGAGAAAAANVRSAAAVKRMAAVAAHKAVCTPASFVVTASPASPLGSRKAKTLHRASLSARVAEGAGAPAAAAGGVVGAAGRAPAAAASAPQPVPTAAEAATAALAEERERAHDALARRLFRPTPVATARGAGGAAAATGRRHPATGGTVRPVAAGLMRPGAAVAQGGVSVGAGPGGAQPSCRRLRAAGARAARLGARLKREKARAEEGVEALRQQLQQEQELLQQQQQQQREVGGKEAGQSNAGAGTSGTAGGALGEGAMVQVGAELCRVNSEDSSAGCSSGSDWEGNMVAGPGRKRVGVARGRRDSRLRVCGHLAAGGPAHTATAQEMRQGGDEVAAKGVNVEQQRLARLWRGEAGEEEEEGSVQGSLDEDRGEGDGDGAEEGPAPLLLRWRPSRDGGGPMGSGAETRHEVVPELEQGDATDDELGGGGASVEASGGGGEGGGGAARWGSLDVEMQVMARLEALLAGQRSGQLPPPQAGAGVGAPHSVGPSPLNIRRPQRSYGAVGAAQEQEVEEKGEGEQELNEVEGQMVLRGVHEGAERVAAAGQVTAPSHLRGGGKRGAAVAERNRVWATQRRGQQGHAEAHLGAGVRQRGSGTGPCQSSGREAREGEGHGPVAESPASGGSADGGHAVAGAESEGEGEEGSSGGEDEDSDWDDVDVDVLMRRALLRAAAAAAVPQPVATGVPGSRVGSVEVPAEGASTRHTVSTEARSGELVPSAADGGGSGRQRRTAGRPAGDAGEGGGDGDAQSGGRGGEVRGAGDHLSDTGGVGGGSRPGSGKGRGAAAALRAEYLALKRAHVS